MDVQEHFTVEVHIKTESQRISGKDVSDLLACQLAISRKPTFLHFSQRQILLHLLLFLIISWHVPEKHILNMHHIYFKCTYFCIFYLFFDINCSFWQIKWLNKSAGMYCMCLLSRIQSSVEQVASSYLIFLFEICFYFFYVWIYSLNPHAPSEQMDTLLKKIALRTFFCNIQMSAAFIYSLLTLLFSVEITLFLFKKCTHIYIYFYQKIQQLHWICFKCSIFSERIYSYSFFTFPMSLYRTQGNNSKHSSSQLVSEALSFYFFKHTLKRTYYT